MTDLDNLRKWAASYGYSLVDKERIKHLSVYSQYEGFWPYKGVIEFRDIAKQGVIRQAALAIHEKLIEYDKYLIEETSEPPYIRLSIELDVIVPRQKGGPR